MDSKSLLSSSTTAPFTTAIILFAAEWMDHCDGRMDYEFGQSVRERYDDEIC